jgi:5'-3' exonuclease
MQYLLVDGKNLLFRAGFASRNLKTLDGRYSGAIHGFIKMLCRVRQQHTESQIIILWENAGDWTYRHTIFAGYKDRKPKTANSPQDSSTTGIHAQIDSVKVLCKSVGLRWIQLPKIEADDLAGLLAVRLVREGHEVLLLSGDKDWWQLASIRGVTVLCEQGNGKNEPVLTDERVAQTFKIEGLRAKDLTRFRPFIGDTSDKIPPAKFRLQTKAAVKLLRMTPDPRKSLAEQSPDIQAFKDIALIWPGYVRNYRLMKIARSIEDCGLTQEQYDTIYEIATGPAPEKHYRQMVRVLAEWELDDALSRRAFIFSVADPQIPGVRSHLG